MKTLEFKVKDISESQFDLHELLVSPSEVGLETEEARFAKPIYGRVQLIRRADEVYVRADFSATIEVECRRCDEPLETDIAAEIEVQFYHTEEPSQIDPWLLDVGGRYYSGDFIDLSEDARQTLTLEIPIWLLCSEACKGLCPQCGENLNMTSCNCHAPEKVSSPFAVLADLLDTPKHAVGE
jgi:uncharacterized protein